MISANGFDNLLFFMGVVEDDSDETNAGRVKVRAFGIHPPLDQPDGVPTEDLPWAVPLNGSYRGAVQIPRKGDWVFGFFIDGRDAQHPFLMGSMEGIQMSSMNDGGEPTEFGYLAPHTASYDTFGEPPLHQFVHGEFREETPELVKTVMRRRAVPTARIPNEDGTMRDGEGWDEFSPAGGHPNYRSVVMPARYGDSYIGISDDDEEENVVITHASGTHIQMDAAGNIKIRSSGDLQIISEDNTNEYTGGVKNETHESGHRVLVQDGSAILEVNGDLNHVVHGDYNINVAGRMAVTVGLGYELACARATIETTAEHFNVISAEKIKMFSGDTTSIHSGTEMYIDSDSSMDIVSEGYLRSHARATHHITSDQSAYLSSFGSNVNITAGGIIAGDAPAIYWNSSRSSPGTASIDTPETPVSPQVDRPVSQASGAGLYQAGVYSSGTNTTKTSVGDGPDILDDGLRG